MRSSCVAFALMVIPFTAGATDMSYGANNFYQSEQVSREQISFKNQFQMTTALRGRMLTPVNSAKRPIAWRVSLKSC